MAYFTNIGPEKGPYLHREARGAAIGVLESRDNHMPIGMALPSRWDAHGGAVWRLTVHGGPHPRAVGRG